MVIPVIEDGAYNMFVAVEKFMTKRLISFLVVQLNFKKI